MSALLLSSAVLAQTATTPNFNKSFRIVRMETAPKIDGVLDEAVWAQATVVDDFHQISPVEYSSPSQRMEIRLFYTKDALYIGARMYDAGKVTAQTLKQKGSIFADDYFGFSIDPYLDKRNGYMFEVNPNGVRFDALFKNITEFESNWDGIWQSEGRIDEHGWTTEIELPFSTVSFNPDTTAWGINFERWIARNSEWIGWVTRERQMNPTINGVANGLVGMEQGHGLDVVPSFVAKQERNFTTNRETDADIEPSLDVFYRITPQLNAALTFNTDFSAADVDTRQVNLSRFNLFFPEKRDFFLRDADIFDFGHIKTNGRPFFSRRIGLNRFGEPIDLDYGGKLSGRAGNFNVGSLYIRQGEDPDTGVGAQDIFVGRATANVLSESTVGVLVTSGDPQAERGNTVYGTDFNYRNSGLPNGKIIEVSGWAQRSETEGPFGTDTAWGVQVNAPNSTGWRGTFEFRQIGDEFYPALGFVNRGGINDYFIDGGYMKRFGKGSPVRSMLARLDYDRVHDLDSGRLSSELGSVRLTVDNQRGDSIEPRLITSHEVLEQDFAIYRATDGSRVVLIPRGDYRFNEAAMTAKTNGARPLSGSVTLRGGEYYDGSHVSAVTSVTWIPARHLNTSVSYTQDRIDLPGGDFTVQLVSAKADTVFSSHWSWSNLVQYDNVSEVVGFNSRVHWQPKAGRDAFLVFNYGLQDRDKDEDFGSTGWDVSLKYSHNLRY